MNKHKDWISKFIWHVGEKAVKTEHFQRDVGKKVTEVREGVRKVIAKAEPRKKSFVSMKTKQPPPEEEGYDTVFGGLCEVM